MTHGSNAFAFRSHRSAFAAAARPAFSLPLASRSIARRAQSSRLMLASTCWQRRSVTSSGLAMAHYAGPQDEWGDAR